MLKRLLSLAFASAALMAQGAPSALAGRWEGSLELDQKLTIQVELKENKTWSGILTIPELEAKIPLEDLKINANRVSFKVNLQGESRFQGELSEDRKQVKGLATLAD
jgi:hypothetical protein